MAFVLLVFPFHGPLEDADVSGESHPPNYGIPQHVGFEATFFNPSKSYLLSGYLVTLLISTQPNVQSRGPNTHSNNIRLYF